MSEDRPSSEASEAPDEPLAAPRAVGRRVPLWLLGVVGVVVGGLLGWGLFALTEKDGDDTDRLTLQRASGVTGDDTATAQAFLDAWRRYRYATYTTPLEFSRVASNGQSLKSTSTYTQQPPRRIVRQADSLLLTAGAESITCNTISGQTVCAPAPNVDYDAEVAKELDIWKTAILADIPYYRVSQPETGCFQLALAVNIVDPPYGDAARFCFDARTGALLKRQIVRASATDTEEATAVSITIQPDAFSVPTTTR